MSSNEPRDQLAAIAKRIRSQAVISTRPGQLDELERIANDLAALELEFAGWRPPPRVIETPENEGDYTAAIAALDTLPRRAIVQVRNHVFQSIGSGWWETVGRHRAFSTEQIVDVADGDSVVVLWEPEETAGEPHRIDVTHVAPGELERMARSGARPSPELRAAIDRARDRKGTDRG